MSNICKTTSKRSWHAIVICCLTGLAVPAAADVASTVRTVCAGCHGEDGNSADPTYPKLAGMDQEYLVRQLKAFAAGKRKDEAMNEIVAGIEPGDFPGLAAHFSRQKSTPGTVKNADQAMAGKAIYEDGNTESGVPACAGCHQPGGQGNARFPRLAGQHQRYVLKQLADYRSGRRATDPLMTTVAKRLGEAEMLAVAEYVAGLRGESK